MTPGAHPLQETEAVMARAAAAARGRAPATVRLPPPWGPHATDVRDHVLLVIDQFEELFLAADAASVRRFLDVLQSAITDRDGRLTVVLTLRADHYDRPLLHPGFAERVHGERAQRVADDRGRAQRRGDAARRTRPASAWRPS